MGADQLMHADSLAGRRGARIGSHRSLMLLAAVILSIPMAAWAQVQSLAEPYSWPGHSRAAVSLAYDDALDSQLDNAIPALERFNLRGTFYVVPASESMRHRLDEWRAAAQRGHELGNHSLFHPCRSSLPGREWVEEWNDLDDISSGEMVRRVTLANTVLQAIDGETERTFTAPCGDLEAGGEHYVDQVKPLFVGIKSEIADGVTEDMRAMDPWAVEVVAPVDATGDEMIALVKRAAELGTMVNFTFHGIGGDYLSVSNDAHEQLLQHLASHPELYWVDTFLNIMKHVHATQAESE